MLTTAPVKVQRANHVQTFADKMGTGVTAAMRKMIQLQERRTAAVAAKGAVARDLARLTSATQKPSLLSQNEHLS